MYKWKQENDKEKRRRAKLINIIDEKIKMKKKIKKKD